MVLLWPPYAYALMYAHAQTESLSPHNNNNNTHIHTKILKKEMFKKIVSIADLESKYDLLLSGAPSEDS